MESKQLNKIVFLIAVVFSLNGFSQMKMADIDDKKFSVNLTAEKKDVIKILDNNSYSVFYILDRRGLDFDEGVGTVDMANLIFFSKKYNKGILTTFKQGIVHDKKSSVYNITLYTGSAGKYMFVPSMIIVDKDFNYEYLMNYIYIHLPDNKNVYTSSIRIQDIKNYCNLKHIDIKDNAIYEDIDQVLSNIPKISTINTSEKCNPIISDMDLKYFFPKKIDKYGRVYYKK